ncbi:histidine kinase [Flavobacterium sp. K5-23]|uniref:sensor histidine kinase n=1 Tax=Flavobacterium sp. K5-23 TaxID=2746225 RepID=UPI00201058C1|nr:histidine kinase [Flavobacterium sp. K5-23]UQD56890.1 histidine kinase [Flavobacterium sp. K5-23]
MKLQNSCFYLFFIFTYSLFGQYLPSKNYTTADGLPNNAVRSLFLDSSDILWIGTENGVSKMENGVFSNLDESDGLGHNSCWDICQDSNGNMWFASYGGGISKYDGKKFTVFTTKNGLLSDKTRKVFPFKHKIYVGTEQGVSIIDINTNKLVTPKVPFHKEDFISISFFEYGDEIYFASIFNGLFKIDESDANPKITPIFLHKNTYALAIYGSTVYSSNEGFIDKFNINDILKDKITNTKFGKSFVWQYAKDKRNSIYAAAWGVYAPDGGLYKIDNDIMIDVSEHFGIDSKILLNVVYDKSKDILYVGSNDKGIYEVRLDRIIDYNLFEAKSVIDFENLGKQKLILHNKGLTILDSKEKILKTISLVEFKNFELNFLKKGNKVFNKQGIESRDFELDFTIPVSGIEFYEMVKNKNSFWIGSNIGIFEINSLGNIINYLPKHSLKMGFTYDDKFIETITYAGVRLYEDVHSPSVKHFSKLKKNTPQYIVKIVTNKDKTYLLSVFNGLYVYKNNQFHSYLAEGIWKEKKFKHITINNKGQLILSAEFGGVFVVDDRKSFKILETIHKDKIVGKSILFLEAYEDYIFIGTEKGINIYHKGKIRLIDNELGLNDCVFTTSQIFDKQLWLGTKKGFFTIDLTTLLKKQPTVSKMSIKNIAINNVPMAKSNFDWFRYPTDELSLDYNQNSLSIDFIPEGHVVPDKLKFRYRLNSTNRWSPYSDKTSLYLAYLPYGNYNLQIEVFDSNAGKFTQFNLLNIIITPPFWLSWWFITLVVIFIIGIAFFYYLRLKKKAKDKIIVEKRIAEVKFEALSNQMNPHFIFNALNSIQKYIVAKDETTSSLYISEFSSLMRQTLKNSSKQTLKLEDEIEYLNSYIFIENMQYSDRILCNINVDFSVDQANLEIPPMLIQPFVENIFVHAFDLFYPSPKINIDFNMIEGSILECKIKDNGKGLKAIKKSKFHISRGIEIARERIILLQNSNKNPIDISITENEGTTVTIRLVV